MKGFISNIEHDTASNSDFRRVVYTGKNLQLVLMTLKPGEEIGHETHHENDQFFRVDHGSGQCVIDGTSHEISDGTAIIVPAGAEHNIINNSSTQELKFYTIYAPPHHRDGTVHTTKSEAESDDEHFDGTTTE